jgi:hypothetical protein
MPMVYSTATNATTYAKYEENKGSRALNRIKRSVTIAGGSNMAQKKTLFTPVGVGTPVTVEELDFLESCPAFQRHKQAGFISVSKSNANNAEQAAADMNSRDSSAPLVPGDFGPNSPLGEKAPDSEASTAKTGRVKQKG